MNKLLPKVFAAMLLAFGTYTALLAADAPASGFALYQGPDRKARLIEAAKKEGELSVYHVYPNLPLIMSAFTKKYGIKVKAWRASSETVLQRLTTEARGGRFEADIVQNNAPENEAAHREKLLQAVSSPYQRDLISQAVPAHKEWVGITLDVWTAAYNTDKVKKEELPKSYRDLLDPKWKGRLGIEAGDHAWFGALMEEVGEDQGIKLFGNIIASNGMSVRKGHSLLTTMVSSGEVPLALSVYSWNPVAIKRKGAPIEGFALSPVIAQPSTIAMLKKAPHPAAAVLFYDFMLSEGQQLLADADYVATSKNIESPFAKISVKFIDPARALDMQEKWFKMYEETVIKKAK